LNAFNDYLFYYQNALQIQDLQRVFTACMRRAHNALKTLQRCHKVPTARCPTRCANAKPWLCFEHVQKYNTTAFTQRCWRLHSAHHGDLQLFERYINAVGKPLWCKRALMIKTRCKMLLFWVSQICKVFFGFDFCRCKPLSHQSAVLQRSHSV